MQGLINRYKCWRHSKGFGIHSPFAYRFITEVVRQHLPYYGYADISSDRRLRLLYRLIVYFRPRRVKIVSSQPTLLEGVIRRASSQTELVSDAPYFLVADASDCATSDLCSMLIPGMEALILNADRATTRAISEALPCGMLFDNRHGTIIIAAYRHLPRQNFDVKF